MASILSSTKKKQIFQEIQQEIAPAPVQKKEWTITQGLSYFRQKWGKRDNDPSTLRRYEHPIELLTQWLTVRKMQNFFAVSDDLKQRVSKVQGSIYNNLQSLHFNLQS